MPASGFDLGAGFYFYIPIGSFIPTVYTFFLTNSCRPHNKITNEKID